MKTRRQRCETTKNVGKMTIRRKSHATKEMVEMKSPRKQRAIKNVGKITIRRKSHATKEVVEMKSPRKQRATKKRTSRIITIESDGLSAIRSNQPVVKLVRLRLPNEGRTASKVVRVQMSESSSVRSLTPDESPPKERPSKVDRSKIVRPPSDELPLKYRNAVKWVEKPNIENKMIEQNISTVNVSRYRYTDIVTFAIDSNGKCYAIKNSGSDVKRFPDISECDENCPKIAASLEFERSIKHFNEFETTLRNLNAKIVQTHNNEWQLYECAAALDKLYVDMCRTRIEKLMFKKQPRIVCTLFDLFGTQIKESNPIWDMVLCIAKTNFSKIKQTFDFDGSDADFIKQFLLDMKLFTEMTAHLSDREKYELIVDPVNVNELDDPINIHV